MARTTRKLSLLVALSFFLAFSPAWADGNTLLERCQAVGKQNPHLNEALNSGFCAGIVQGVLTTITNFGSLLPKNLQVCLPGGVNTWQCIKIVQKYLKENPEQLHLDEESLIHLALLKAFPCN